MSLLFMPMTGERHAGSMSARSLSLSERARVPLSWFLIFARQILVGLNQRMGKINIFLPVTCTELMIYSLREARILFKAGKNRDGYFNCIDLCVQTDVQLNSLKTIFLVLQLQDLDLIMPLGTKNELTMHFRLVPCQNFPNIGLGKKQMQDVTQKTT